MKDIIQAESLPKTPEDDTKNCNDPKCEKADDKSISEVPEGDVSLGNWDNLYRTSKFERRSRTNLFALLAEEENKK